MGKFGSRGVTRTTVQCTCDREWEQILAKCICLQHFLLFGQHCNEWQKESHSRLRSNLESPCNFKTALLPKISGPVQPNISNKSKEHNIRHATTLLRDKVACLTCGLFMHAALSSYYFLLVMCTSLHVAIHFHSPVAF